MSDDVTPWRPEDAAEQMREKIREEFTKLIPDEQLDKMIQDTITNFMRTDLDKLVRHNLQQEIATRLRDYFEKPEWQEQWSYSDVDGGQDIAGEAVMKLIEKHSMSLMQSILANAVQQVFTNMRHQL